MKLLNADYIVLRELDDLSHGKLAQILNNNGAANLTVCPHCHVDDFVHITDCPLGLEHSIIHIAKKYGLQPVDK